MGIWTSPWRTIRPWMAVVVALSLIAAVVATFAHRALIDLRADDYAHSVRRFTAGPRELVIDPRASWSRIPRILPGPADAWAGGIAHAIAFDLRPRPTCPLVLYVSVDDAAAFLPAVSPGRLTVTVDGAPVATLKPAGHGARHRRRVLIPTPTRSNDASLRLTVINDQTGAIALERLRLVEATPTFALRHLARRGRFPPEYRIAVLGDSLSWGIGVALAERFARRIEDHLNARRPSERVYEVLTFAQIGWDTDDEVQALRTLVVRASPDFVIL
jgi:hypothetical protein